MVREGFRRLDILKPEFEEQEGLNTQSWVLKRLAGTRDGVSYGGLTLSMCRCQWVVGALGV